MSTSHTTTVFVYNVYSADKSPGMGNMEFLSDNDKKNPEKFKTLSSIKQWRKQLSNFFTVDITVDGDEWASVEHCCIGMFLKSKNDINYMKFMKDGDYCDRSVSDLKQLTKTLCKAYPFEYDEDVLENALSQKFHKSTHHDLYLLLMSTKDATLVSWSKGMDFTVNKENEKIASSCIVSNVLMRVRATFQNEIIAEETITLSRCNNQEDQISEIPPCQNIVTTKTKTLKDLVKKDILNINSLLNDYNVSKNLTSPMMTIYEKTNVIGIRQEQLAFGAHSTLPSFELKKLNSVKQIALKEYEMKLLPFIICRKLPDNSKEYWKLNDMIIL